MFPVKSFSKIACFLFIFYSLIFLLATGSFFWSACFSTLMKDWCVCSLIWPVSKRLKSQSKCILLLHDIHFNTLIFYSLLNIYILLQIISFLFFFFFCWISFTFTLYINHLASSLFWNWTLFILYKIFAVNNYFLWTNILIFFLISFQTDLITFMCDALYS